MTIKTLSKMILPGLAGLFMMITAPAQAAIITGLTTADMGGATLEAFKGGYVNTASYDFGNGMMFQNLNGENDLINYTGGYGMGLEPSIVSGLDGAGDGYFGTGLTPTTFELAFAGGVSKFGFYGAESLVADGLLGRNGVLDLLFYDTANNLMASISVVTAGTFAWDQFHGFASDAGLIGRVVFDGVGHMVLDNVYFDTANVAEPTSLILLGLSLFGLGFARRR